MPRLTQSDRDRLRRQLLDALVPTDRDAARALEQAAARAVLTDYYTPAGLKRLAAMPAEWFDEVKYVYLTPTGQKTARTAICAPLRLPRTPPTDYRPGEAAQRAVDLWCAHVDAHTQRSREVGHRIDTVLEASATLDSLLARLPEARDILQLPPAADVAASAAEINAALAARPAPKPARKG